jgi:hypothetical protein
MTKVWIFTAVAFALWLHVHITDQAYQSGYADAEKRLGATAKQKYNQGYADAKKALGTTAEQCYRWWFGGNTKQFEHEMKQFCKRSDV